MNALVGGRSSLSRIAVGLAALGRPAYINVGRDAALPADRTVEAMRDATWRVLDAAYAAGVHVLVEETLANGRLATTPPAALARVAERHGRTPDAIAIAAALDQPWADTVLVGPASTAQLATNLQATTVRLTADDRRDLAHLPEPLTTYWSTRTALPWA